MSVNLLDTSLTPEELLEEWGKDIRTPQKIIADTTATDPSFSHFQKVEKPRMLMAYNLILRNRSHFPYVEWRADLEEFITLFGAEFITDDKIQHFKYLSKKLIDEGIIPDDLLIAANATIDNIEATKRGEEWTNLIVGRFREGAMGVLDGKK